MTRIRILNLEPKGYSAHARAILHQLGEISEGPLTREELIRTLPEVDVLLVRLGHAIDREIIESSRSLRAIVSATTGLDHIDVRAAGERGVAVLSLQGEIEFLSTVHATAEHTWALLLSLRRLLVPAALSVRQGEWNRERFTGRELHGSRLGLVGVGRIGSKVAGYGRAFGMRVSAYDPYVADWPEGVLRVESLPTLLAESDILSVHIPLNDETSNLLNAERLALLPRGAVLVNTSRGEIVDENALADALEEGRLAGAALDTVHNERDAALRTGGRLMAIARDADYLLITPHIGGAAEESMAKTELFMAKKLARFLQAHT